MGEYIVYRHTSPNGKMYVGITHLMPKRRWHNGRGYVHNQHFSNAIKKYGWDNFKHEILLEGLTKEQAQLAEKLFIGYWDLMNQDKGYNLTSGGEVGKEMSEETRTKMSNAHKGDKNYNYQRRMDEQQRLNLSMSRRGNGNPMYGKHHSKATKLKMSISQSGEKNGMYGKTHSLDAKNTISMKQGHRVIAIDITTGDIVGEYQSMRVAEKVTGVAHEHISACCRNKQRTAGGYKWQYI